MPSERVADLPACMIGPSEPCDPFLAMQTRVRELELHVAEKAAIIAAIDHEKDELRARAHAEMYRRAEATHRAQRVILDLEVTKERDALREQVRVLTLERDRQHAELDKRQNFMQRRGYVQCDIPACNCPYWHGGHAERRLDEIADALGSRWWDQTVRLFNVNGQTVLQAVEQLACERDALREQVRALELHVAEKALT